jgi:Transglycosylase SLT domain
MAVYSATANAAPQITGAIQQAARSSGISFEYLLTTAQIESNLNPSAQAPTSSAKGLYQFIDQTWLGTMKTSGPANGYGRYADAISQSPDGYYEVADPAMRTAIMQLRSDPTASATMAGAFTRANADQLQSAIGRAPTEGELYIAHFLGSEGAGKLITTATTQPQANAAELFPKAAAANQSIFYDGAGRARSVSNVYAKLTGRFEAARAISFTPSLMTVDRTNAVQSSIPDTKRPASPDTAGVTQAFAQANQNVPPLPDSRPLFQSMFTDRARKAVTQTVSSLWTPGKTGAPASTEPARPLDLFTDIQPNTRKLLGGNSL